MDERRRDFLKKAGLAALGAGGAFPLLGAAGKIFEDSLALTATGKAFEDSLATAAPDSKQWGMVVDVQKCLQPEVLHACTEACRREHNIPQIPDPDERVEWIWSESYENAFPDQQHPYTAASLRGKPVLVLCNHCTKPPCVKVCPTQATWKREQDGIVMMDMHRCIGCRYCIAACPYGARSFNWRDPRPYIEGPIRPEFPTRSKGVVEKCTFCEARLREGLPPACVAAAEKTPGGEGALTFGDLSDPDSDIRKLLDRRPTIVRRPSLGTGPNVFYIV
jgi:molybdopterin-containing oxidoreductase family iron-sulfur binding subunit